MISDGPPGHGDSGTEVSATGGLFPLPTWSMIWRSSVHQLGVGPVRYGRAFDGRQCRAALCRGFPRYADQAGGDRRASAPPPEYRAKQRAVPYPDASPNGSRKSGKPAGRSPRKYDSIEAAFARMIEENAYLTEEQARHLTVHGIKPQRGRHL